MGASSECGTRSPRNAIAEWLGPDDDHAMPITLPCDAPRPVLRDVRCACGVCGAHLIAWQGHTLSGSCDNCGSYDVRPVAQTLADLRRAAIEALRLAPVDHVPLPV
jgi:hypothetical protein